MYVHFISNMYTLAQLSCKLYRSTNHFLPARRFRTVLCACTVLTVSLHFLINSDTTVLHIIHNSHHTICTNHSSFLLHFPHCIFCTIIQLEYKTVLSYTYTYKHTHNLFSIVSMEKFYYLYLILPSASSTLTTTFFFPFSLILVTVVMTMPNMLVLSKLFKIYVFFFKKKRFYLIRLTYQHPILPFSFRHMCLIPYTLFVNLNLFIFISAS